ncbi:MAG TPA: FlgD immunoglobulin-like domain containing protein [bacterium]|nr:FlgD immunoglobulin-like domain containing protein [bacterium]
MPRAEKATIEIYNVLGQRVRTLYSGNLKAGVHTVQWDARDNHGNQVSAGVYIYRMSTPHTNKTKKMILLK